VATLIVDGNNLAKRVWKGTPMLTTSSGKHVSTIFGVLRALRSGVVRFKPSEVLVTWDDHPKARLAIFPEYKKKRKEKRKEFTPEEEEEYRQHNEQVKELFNIIAMLGVHQYKGKNIEADDIIALLAKESSDKAIILSEDKDFLQLVSEKVHVYRPMADKYYTVDNFEEHTGVATPEMYLHVRFITGDSSDEIPGVPGFKETRALPLIQKHGDIRKVMAAAKLEKGKLMQTLASSTKTIARNILLMDLRYSVDFMYDELYNIRYEGSFDEREFRATLIKYEFYSFLRNMREFMLPFKNLVR